MAAKDWLGAWAWRDVAEALRARDHTVYPVTLTGLADREHLGGPQVTLDTHVADVVNLLRYEDLRDLGDAERRQLRERAYLLADLGVTRIRTLPL